MRMFTAIPIRGAVADELHRWVQEHRPSLPFRKWTHPQDYHLTVQFLGEVPEDRLEELHIALKSVQVQRISLALNGGGTFGQARSPRVLFGSVTGDRDGLKALHASVLKSTEPLGFLPEARPYSPHITLARNYSADSKLPFPPGLLESMPSGASWLADRFVLMRTHMHSSPMYETVYEYSAPS